MYRSWSLALDVYAMLGLPGWHDEKNPDTLDLFPSSMRQPKIEGLDLYTYVHLCPVRAEIFNRTSRLKTGQSGSKPDGGHLATLCNAVIQST